jgi:hypothetical protein
MVSQILLLAVGLDTVIILASLGEMAFGVIFVANLVSS